MKLWQILVGVPAIAGWTGLLWWAIIKPLIPSRRERAIRRAIRRADEYGEQNIR